MRRTKTVFVLTGMRGKLWFMLYSLIFRVQVLAISKVKLPKQIDTQIDVYVSIHSDRMLSCSSDSNLAKRTKLESFIGRIIRKVESGVT